MIRVGVVGTRFGAQVHVPAFRADSRCVVAAIAGRDPERARAAALALDVPASHGDWRSLVADPDIDAVSIALPPREQPAVVIEAARLGKHVFCEKPLAATLLAAEEAFASATRAGVVHAIDFLFPEIPAWARAKALLASGAIGRPRHFSYTWRIETYASRTGADSWKNRDEEGGGAVGNFLSHVIFNIEWLLDRVVGLDRVARRGAVGAGAFCDCVAVLAGGMHGSIAISTDAYLGGGHEIRVFGDAGTLVLRNGTADYASGFEVFVGTRQSGGLEVDTPALPQQGGDGRISPVVLVVRRFLDAIERGGVMTPDLEDGVRVQQWLQRAAMSHVS